MMVTAASALAPSIRRAGRGSGLSRAGVRAEVVLLAREYMALDRQGLEVVERDAYDFLARTRRRFDGLEYRALGQVERMLTKRLHVGLVMPF